jgi:hypothetical protein
MNRFWGGLADRAAGLGLPLGYSQWVPPNQLVAKAVFKLVN